MGNDLEEQELLDEARWVLARRENLPENTTNPLCTLSSSPFIKTQFVDVIPACCFTPDDFLLVGLEFHKADGAVIFNGFSIAGGVVVRVGGLAA